MKCVPGLPSALLLIVACNGPVPKDRGATPTPAQPDSATLAERLTKAPEETEQISQYIRRIFQDRDGNLWFGTTSDGVARYDGRSLRYFTPADGFSSNWVGGIAQAASGDLWFATGGGVTRYDPSAELRTGATTFTNYTTKDGLAHDQVYCLLLDKSGGFWFGTEEGVSRFDPSSPLRTGSGTFTAFPIPPADFSHHPNYQYPKQINCIVQDKSGNIWFATNGAGVYKYEGSTLTNLSEKDGLCNNFVQTIIEDRDGNLWFGSRYGGLCKYDGKIFTLYGRKDGVLSDQIWVLYQDSAGIIWIGASAYGLCSYDGKTFTCHTDRDGAGLKNVQSILEDANGQLWIGTSSGVHRYEGGRFVNWTKREAVGVEP
ncbi:MAG: two-component regulator propeller domain-containing protein [Flavobacteriales bacterium]